MARFYFDLNECGDLTIDEDGVERADMDAVRESALHAAREVMCAELAEGRLCMSCHILVRDEAGVEVLKIPFKEAVTITGL